MPIFTTSVPTHNFPQIFTSLMKRFPNHIVKFNLGQSVSTIVLSSRMALEDLIFEANRQSSNYYILSNIPDELQLSDVEKVLSKAGFQFQQISTKLSNNSYIVQIHPEQAMKINKIQNFYFTHLIQIPIILVSNAHYIEQQEIQQPTSIQTSSIKRQSFRRYKPNKSCFNPNLSSPSKVAEDFNRTSRVTRKWRDFSQIEVTYE